MLAFGALFHAGLSLSLRSRPRDCSGFPLLKELSLVKQCSPSINLFQWDPRRSIERVEDVFAILVELRC